MLLLFFFSQQYFYLFILKQVIIFFFLLLQSLDSLPAGVLLLLEGKFTNAGRHLPENICRRRILNIETIVRLLFWITEGCSSQRVQDV